jgi:predicted transcriptional regulator
MDQTVDVINKLLGVKMDANVHNKSSQRNSVSIKGRRPLTTEECLWADNLSKVWHQRADRKLSQERAAELLGYSAQSTVSQYINKIIPLNDTAVIAFSRLLRIEPGKIKPDLADLSIMYGDTISAITEMCGKALAEDQEIVFQRFERIVDHRKLTKVAIARFFDVKPPSIHKWFSDRKIPPERLFRLPKLLNCNILDLVSDNFDSCDQLGSIVVDGTTRKPPEPRGRVKYSKKTLTNAVDTVISRSLRVKLGIMRAVEESAISLFSSEGEYEYVSDIIKTALLDLREHGEFVYAYE